MFIKIYESNIDIYIDSQNGKTKKPILKKMAFKERSIMSKI